MSRRNVYENQLWLGQSDGDLGPFEVSTGVKIFIVNNDGPGTLILEVRQADRVVRHQVCPRGDTDVRYTDNGTYQVTLFIQPANTDYINQVLVYLHVEDNRNESDSLCPFGLIDARTGQNASSHLRAWREQFLAKSEHGRALIAQHYENADRLHFAMSKFDDGDMQQLHSTYVAPMLSAIGSGKHYGAVRLYRQLISDIERRSRLLLPNAQGPSHSPNNFEKSHGLRPADAGPSVITFANDDWDSVRLQVAEGDGPCDSLSVNINE